MNIKESPLGIILTVKVTPKAKQNHIIGWEEGLFKIKVTASPEKGAANRAVIHLLSKQLSLPQKNIILLKGSTSRIKQFCLEGISLESAQLLLNI